jgi:LysR family pca operon transcriptional activator
MNVDLPEQITVCGTVSLLKSLVAETDHLALLPAHAVEEEVTEHRLCILPFADPTFARDIAVFFREGYAMDQAQRDLVAGIEQTGLELCRQRAET